MKKTLSIILILLLCLGMTGMAAAAESICIVAGSGTLCGSEWNATDPNNAMTLKGAIYEKVYTNVPAGDYQFKVVHNGDWKGKDGKNVLFTVKSTCDVTITYDPTTEEIRYAGPSVEDTAFSADAIYARGAANPGAPHWLNGTNWDLSESNQLALIGADIYGIIYANLPAGTYECKFCTDENWTHNWGGTFSEFGMDCDAVYNSSENITFTLTEAADVTLRLDLSAFNLADTTAKFSVSLSKPGTAVLPAYKPEGENKDNPPAQGENKVQDSQDGEAVYYVAGDEALCGSFWMAADPNNRMNEGSNGVWTKVYDQVPAGAYALKVTGGTWDNSWGGDGTDGNYEFTIQSVGKVTVRFDEAAKAISHTFEASDGTPSPTEPPMPDVTGQPSTGGQLSNFRVVGNTDWMGDWNAACDLGRMTQKSPGVYKKIFRNVPAGAYELKITENGTWDRCWGDNGGNYKFKVSKTSDICVIFRYDGTNGTISIKEVPPGTGDSDLLIVAVLLLCSATAVTLLIMNKKRLLLLCLCPLMMGMLFLPAHAYEPDCMRYRVENGQAIIEGYDYEMEGELVIPEIINGYPVTGIDGSAFLGREWLTSVTLPDTVTRIGFAAFAHCDNLQTVSLPAGVSDLQSSAFMDCASLTGIWVDPDNMDYSSDDRGVLYNKNKTALLQVPASLKGEFTVPDTVIEIGFSAFQGCKGLTAIHIPETVKTIGGYAFCDCAVLTELNIPASVLEIGDQAFEDCDALAQIWVADGNRRFSSDTQGVLYNQNKTALLYVPAAFSGDYTVAQGVTSIGNSAFAFCEGLTSITVPEGVTHIGHYAFFNCSNLRKVVLPQSLREIDGYAFQDCSSLTQINIPNRVTHIQWGLFRGCTRLSEFPVHDAVTNIDDFAFGECHSLKNIVFPASVKRVGHFAFHDCRGLEKLYFCGDAPDFVMENEFCGAFAKSTAKAYYHSGTEGWTEDAKFRTGGTIRWTQADHLILPGESKCIVCSATDVPTAMEPDASHIVSGLPEIQPVGTHGNLENTGKYTETTSNQYRVVGNADWMGNWNPASDKGLMTQIEPGVYRVVFENVKPGKYELKVTENGGWDRCWGDNGQNFAFTVSSTNDVTVIFTLKKDQGVISVKDTAYIGLEEESAKTCDSNVGFMMPMLLLSTAAALLLLNRFKKNTSN